VNGEQCSGYNSPMPSGEDFGSILFAINRVPGVKDSRVQDKKVKRFHLNP